MSEESMSLLDKFCLQNTGKIAFLSEIEWTDDANFIFRGEQFTIDLGWAGKRENSKLGQFIIVKNKTHLNSYFDLMNYSFDNIFEVGFFEGGSSVFFDLFYRPNQLTCIDRRKGRIGPVDEFIGRSGREDNFRMVYDVDQGDQERLSELIDTYHSGTLDLVVDDASHQYELTKRTFETLFPRLNPGGLYVIEDYGWAHDPRYQRQDHIWASRPALSNLVFELTMICAGVPALIHSVFCNRGLCFIRKGSASSSKELFDFSPYLNPRGKRLNLI